MKETNKKVVKNTVFLYFRMILILLVTLYTSRVILKELGVKDYGIYNVVGGVVAMFSVITNSLSQAISRFITFELGKSNLERLKILFSTSLTLQLTFSAIVLLLAELLGVWFLNTHMNIPPDRMEAANWVMQCVIVMFIINLIIVPFNATIIAHEDMRAFAYISILEAFLKLIVAFLVKLAFFDSLKFYALALLLASCIVGVIYIMYASKRFTESKIKVGFNKKVFQEMFSFAGWNFVSALSGVLQTQGINIILNLFFGPAVNAARGLAVQIENAVNQLGNSIATSINPQIIKTYASQKLEEMHILLCRGTKFIYFLLLILSLPIFFKADFFISVWLVEVPSHTSNFLKILLLGILVDMSANPLYTGIHATGNIRTFVFLNSGIRLLILPVSYICLKYGAIPESVFIVQISFWHITQIPRLILLHKLVGLPYKMFMTNAFLPIALVSVVSLLVLVPFSFYFSSATWLSAISMSFLSVFITAACVFILGLTSNERKAVLRIPNKLINKLSKQ